MPNEYTWYHDGHPGGRRKPSGDPVMRYRTRAICGRQLPEGYLDMPGSKGPGGPKSPPQQPGQGPGKQGPLPPKPPKK